METKTTTTRSSRWLLPVIALAALAAAAFIFLNFRGAQQVTTLSSVYSEIEQSRTADGAFRLGSPDAPITVVEFADFLCGHCQEYHEEMQQFIQEYVATGKAAFEYRMFPTVDQQALTARLAECAVEQGANFWEVHDTLFSLARRGWNAQSGQELASQLDLNYTEMLACAPNAEQFITDATFGGRLGVNGTPAVMIRLGNGQPQYITLGGQEYNRGGVPLEVIAAAVNAAQPAGS